MHSLVVVPIIVNEYTRTNWQAFLADLDACFWGLPTWAKFIGFLILDIGLLRTIRDLYCIIKGVYNP